MAMSNAVWGIDIGQCALKALKCSYDHDTGVMVPEAFDYIEYPKILTQPESDPEVMVREALEEFLSRNDTRRDKVAISVPGQAGLARFFKPPPVDEKMIPDIVKYEAKQQIPFPLEDVIWDYQKMGGTEVDGITLDAEVGLFAMKREQVYRHVAPFTDAGVELWTVQLAPLTVFNFVCHEVLGEEAIEEIDPNDPPESLVVVSMGTETTDLVITNGVRLWQRSIPLGGSHFTRQLSKELKLTFAKAEHLKRNARKAEDPKAVFQAMRPVFNDLVTEIQRSVGFFQSLDRQAKLGRVVILGNTVKLPGLRQYLSKNLGQDVVKIDSFEHLQDNAISESPKFKENHLSFATCYGLCLQGLGKSALKTNLIPRQFVTERLIREKKPWAIAAVALVMLALAINFFFIYRAWAPTDDGYKVADVDWVAAKRQVEETVRTSTNYQNEDQALMAELVHVQSMGEEVVGSGDRKLLWVELMKAINECLPRDELNGGSHDTIRRVEDYPFEDRKELIITHIESEYFLALEKWFSPAVKRAYAESLDEAAPVEDEVVVDGVDAVDGGAVVDGVPAADEFPVASEFPGEGDGVDPDADNPLLAGIVGPTGPGWVIQLSGLHFHNSSREVEGGWGPQYVYNTLIKNLKEKKIVLPIEPPQEGKAMETAVFTMKELGIQYPTLVYQSAIDLGFKVGNPNYINLAGSTGEGFGEERGFESPSIPPTGGAGATDDPDAPEVPDSYRAPRFEFVVQFAWVEQPLTQRLETRKKLAAEKTAAEREAARLRLEEGLGPDAAPQDNPVPPDAAAPEPPVAPAN